LYYYFSASVVQGTWQLNLRDFKHSITVQKHWKCMCL